jgi:hypothetical protein
VPGSRRPCKDGLTNQLRCVVESDQVGIDDQMIEQGILEVFAEIFSASRLNRASSPDSAIATVDLGSELLKRRA